MIKTYKGLITKLEPHQVFVFGANPAGIHGAGAAKAAMAFGAKYGQGRGHMGQTYGLVTKNLTQDYTEECSGITYRIAGERSVSVGQIINNILELYLYATKHPELEFMVGYTLSPNLNGYTTEEMATMFSFAPIPSNIVFNEDFAKLITY